MTLDGNLSKHGQNPVKVHLKIASFQNKLRHLTSPYPKQPENLPKQPNNNKKQPKTTQQQ